MTQAPVLIYVHSGLPSVDNGAKAPLSFMFELAKATDSTVIAGQYHGDDQLSVPSEHLALVEELLNEHKMLWRFPGDTTWRNIQQPSKLSAQALAIH